MLAIVVVLSGPSKVGKTKVSAGLIKEFGAEALRADTAADADVWLLVVDGVSDTAEVFSIRSRFPNRRVVHFYLDALNDALTARGATAPPKRDPELAGAADHVLDTTLMIENDVLACVVGLAGALAPQPGGFVDVVVGGQYGSEGKGQICGHLAPAYDFLMRVGGPNAGHTFTNMLGARKYFHLPSGARDVRARVLIGAGAVLKVDKLVQEIQECNLNPDRLMIDARAMVISEEDVRRESEEGGVVARIASTGQGVGSATARKIMGRGAGTILASDAAELKSFIGDTVRELERAYAEGRRILLEGTQGSRLSIHHGSYPHVTSRDTNASGCLGEAGIPPVRVRKIVMVVRRYPIRVGSAPKGGSSGEFNKEITPEIIADRSGLDAADIRAKEKTTTTGRDRRFGEFEWDQFQRACALNAPTDLAFSFADYIDKANRDAGRFDQLTAETQSFIGQLEQVSGIPVSMVNARAEAWSVLDRRSWS